MALCFTVKLSPTISFCFVNYPWPQRPFPTPNSTWCRRKPTHVGTFGYTFTFSAISAGGILGQNTRKDTKVQMGLHCKAMLYSKLPHACLGPWVDQRHGNAVLACQFINCRLTHHFTGAAKTWDSLLWRTSGLKRSFSCVFGWLNILSILHNFSLGEDGANGN